MVDQYIGKHLKFEALLYTLRNILLESGLEETIKWGAPTYILNNKNLIGLAAFKNHVSLWFHQGVFLKDECQVLINAQEKTKYMRQMRFKCLYDLDENVVRQYINECVLNAKNVTPILPQNKKLLILPESLLAAVESNQEVKSTFEALSLSKKREFGEYIAEAKRESTVNARLNKVMELLARGQGLNDKYKVKSKR